MALVRTDVGPAAIKVQRQGRRVDGRGLSGSRSRDRLGDRRAINGDGLSHQRRSLLRRGRILQLQRQREDCVYHRSPNAVFTFRFRRVRLTRIGPRFCLLIIWSSRYGVPTGFGGPE